ncbi:MAG: translation initiation factor [Chitinophagia bacterium]|jgi:translation initiation factor 1
MKKKQTSSGNGIVFSTNPSFQWEPEEAAQETLPSAQQELRIQLDKKQRAGKVVTLITGFVGADGDLESLGKTLRNFCGTGGSSKEGLILVQGDQREKVLQCLQKNGYTKTKKIG